MSHLVVAFGHRYRGDDGAGFAVIDQLGGMATFGATGNALAVFEAWNGYERVTLVDAMRSDRPPGTVAWIDADEELPATRFVASTHSFGPIELVRLARALDVLPPRLDIVGIEAGTVAMGGNLSAEVAEAAAALAEELRDA